MAPDPDISRGVRIRMALLVLAFAAGAVWLVKRSYELGVTDSARLRQMGEEQWLRNVKRPARRGAIFDRNGADLAVSVPVDSVYAHPRRVSDPSRAAVLLGEVLNQDIARIRKRLESKAPFVWIKRHVTPSEADKIRSLEIPGVELLEETKRFYPNRNLASHVLGFVGIDGNGLEGIEKTMDEELRGRDDALRGVRDAAGRVVFIEEKGRDSTGNSLVLTIDKTLQYTLETELAAAARTFEAVSASAVMIDPPTGEILALANVPDYNPNTPGSSAVAARRNRALTDPVEPGSTFKIFTVAAALNSGVLQPDEMLFCENGKMEIGDIILHDTHRDGWLSLTQVIARSSNIAISKIALKLGKQRLYRYVRRFGFGESTGVPAPFETRGILRPPNKWYDVDLATIAFGQGVSVSALQLAMATGALANNGVLMKPRLVRRIVDSEGGLVRDFPPGARRRVVSPYSSRLVRDIMTAVTEKGGTGEEAALRGFLVAGKTGTAQKATSSGGYHADKRVALFVGFVPAESPRIAMAVIMDEPSIGRFGGTVAAPVFRRTADQGLRYLGVAPRGVEHETPVVLAHAKKCRNDDKEKTSKVEAVHKDVMVTGEMEVVVPDITGKSIAKVLKTGRKAGLKVEIEGSGISVSQTPEPGTTVEKGAVLFARFSRP